MDILRNLRRFESRLTRTVDEAAQKISQPGPREPLEILHAIVETVEKRIEPTGRGKYVFPFNRITLSIAAGSRETQARFEAVLGSEPSLQDRIAERLHASGCDSTGLSIETTYAACSEPQWITSNFDIQFDRVISPPQQPAPPTGVAHHSLKLMVVQGAAEEPSYVLAAPRINLGRCPEVRDSRNRLIRTNHVAFVENAGDPNRTVSRNHAHIEYTAGPGEYRLRDDRSAHGTSVRRDGTMIAVPPGSRGIRLQSGDEIFLGEACLRVEIDRGMDEELKGE